MNTFFCSSRMLLFFIRLILGGVTWLSHHDVLIAVVCTTVINLCYFLLQKGMLIIIFCVTHSLVDLPRWRLATADDHSDIVLLHRARSCDISFSWMYSQPVHSSMSCIHCLLGLPWCRSLSMIPSRTVSANRPALVSVHKHNVAAKFMDFAHNA